MSKQATDILVQCGNPEAFEKTIKELGAAVLITGVDGYKKIDNCYVMRVFGDPGFIKFAITSQGYGQIIKELAELV